MNILPEKGKVLTRKGFIKIKHTKTKRDFVTDINTKKKNKNLSAFMSKL